MAFIHGQSNFLSYANLTTCGHCHLETIKKEDAGKTGSHVEGLEGDLGRSCGFFAHLRGVGATCNQFNIGRSICASQTPAIAVTLL